MKNLKQVVENAVKNLQVEEKEKPTKKEKKCPCNEPGIATPIRYSAKCCKKKEKTRKSKSSVKEQQQQNACTQSDFNDISAQNDLNGLFVNGNPTNFINRMLNKYDNKGCDQDGGVFRKLKMKHEDHLDAGKVGNKIMGPKWKAQKSSKVAFLNQLIQDCCPHQPGQGGGGNPSVIENNSLLERFQKLANIIK